LTIFSASTDWVIPAAEPRRLGVYGVCWACIAPQTQFPVGKHVADGLSVWV
jgi:hypothetical protein